MSHVDDLGMDALAKDAAYYQQYGIHTSWYEAAEKQDMIDRQKAAYEYEKGKLPNQKFLTQAIAGMDYSRLDPEIAYEYTQLARETSIGMVAKSAEAQSLKADLAKQHQKIHEPKEIKFARLAAGSPPIGPVTDGMGRPLNG